MRLESDDGSWIELRPVAYQFPDAAPQSDGYNGDANWLEIAGEVHDAKGPSWSFADPCMDTHEARQMSEWLRRIATDHASAVEATRSGSSVFWLTEPNLVIEAVDQDLDRVSMLWRFALESAPPGSSDEIRLDGYEVRVVASRASLSGAAHAWDEHLAEFPER